MPLTNCAITVLVISATPSALTFPPQLSGCNHFFLRGLSECAKHCAQYVANSHDRALDFYCPTRTLTTPICACAFACEQLAVGMTGELQIFTFSLSSMANDLPQKEFLMTFAYGTSNLVASKANQCTGARKFSPNGRTFQNFTPTGSLMHVVPPRAHRNFMGE